MDEPPSEKEIVEFKRAVTQRRVEYLKLIRDKGFAIDEDELARFEAELAAPQKED
jgi:hypothetical protein